MSALDLLKIKKIGLLGFGNMNQAILKAWMEKQALKPEKVFVTNRTEGKAMKAVEEYGVTFIKNNEELVDQCDVIVLGVKPQDLDAALEPIASSFTEEHMVISLAAGVSLDGLSKLLPSCNAIARVMPNTPVRIGRGVLGYSMTPAAEVQQGLIEELLKHLGLPVVVEEGEVYDGFTVACGSGPGFVFEIMQIWQEWLEGYDFSKEEARQLTLETFLGSCLLAEKHSELSIEDLQRQVTSKGGGTAKGIEAMREQELERILRISFEKAFMRFQELGQTSV